MNLAFYSDGRQISRFIEGATTDRPSLSRTGPDAGQRAVTSGRSPASCRRERVRGASLRDGQPDQEPKRQRDRARGEGDRVGVRGRVAGGTPTVRPGSRRSPRRRTRRRRPGDGVHAGRDAGLPGADVLDDEVHHRGEREADARRRAAPRRRRSPSAPSGPTARSDVRRRSRRARRPAAAASSRSASRGGPSGRPRRAWPASRGRGTGRRPVTDEPKP